MSLPFKKLFFLGVGGSGMSSLAHIALDMGIQVYGSDKSIDSSPVISLQKRGAVIENKKEHAASLPIDAVIYSTAIDKNRNELYVEFLKKNIPLFHRSELLHKIFSLKKSIAVAGSHGKTSTTAMVAQILMRAGYDPAIMVGGEIPFLSNRGGRWGEGDWGVYESDESDGTFLNHSPLIKIVTNIDNDHLDYYKNFDGLVSAFTNYISCSENSKSVVYANDPGISEVLQKIEDKKGILTYSETDNLFGEKNIQFQIVDGSLKFQKNGQPYTLKNPFAGDHYLKNSLAAVLAAELLGISIEESIEILSQYSGVKRRLEYIGEKEGIRVIDDYGHHPTEIQSVIGSINQMKNSQGRCVVLFQPHRFTRTKELYKEFADALGDSDFVFLLPIYSAGEEPVENVSSSLIYENFSEKKKILMLDGDRPADLGQLSRYLRRNDILVTLGAGNVRDWGEMFLQ